MCYTTVCIALLIRSLSQQYTQHDKILGHCTRPDLPIALQAMILLVVVVMKMKEDWENDEKERMVKLSALTMVTTNHGKSLLGSRQQELKLYASG